MDFVWYVAIPAVVTAVLLYAAGPALLRRLRLQPGEIEAVRAERDRLAAECVSERSLSSEAAMRAARLSGLLEAKEAELESRALTVTSVQTELQSLRARLESATIAARTAAAAEAERQSALIRLQELIDVERLNSANRIQELSSALSDALIRAETNLIAARTAESSLAEREDRLAKLEATVERGNVEQARLQADLANARTELAQASANLQHLQNAQEELKQFVATAQTRLSGAFTELAGKAFEERAQAFNRHLESANVQSKADIDSILKPFAERLSDFRQRVDTLYGEEAKERAALFGAVTELKSLNQDMAAQTSALTRALKGSSKVRGDWGELILETVLQGSGLEEGTHYERQVSTTDDDGQLLRPDVIVRLPDDRRIVVDSKVSLLSWIEAVNAETPEKQQDATKRHIAALRQHVRDLGERNYPRSLGVSALELTIAFVPMEGALSGALGFDDSLQAYAFEHRVVFASPNTLMAMLGVVDRLWTRDRVQRQALEISEAGGKVLDALGRFITEFDKIGAKLGVVQDAFADARRCLTESSQAVLPRARRLAELGARGKKALHADLEPDLSDQIELLNENVAPAVGESAM